MLSTGRATGRETGSIRLPQKGVACAGLAEAGLRGWSSRRVRRLGLLLLKLVAVLLVAGPVFGQQDFTGSTLVFPANGVGSNAPVTQVMTLTPVNGTTIRSVDVPLGFTGSPEFEVLSVTGCVVDGTTVNAAGTACKVLVRFAPRGPGIRTARLLVNSGLASVSVFGLVGTGFYATAAITPSLTSVLAGAGPASAGYSGDGDVASAAVLNGPQGMAFDTYGNLYFSDTGNNAVRMLDAFGNITTIAGTGTAGYSGDNSFAFLAKLNQPTYLAVDAAQNLYIADSGNNVIRRISLGPAPIITTFAGGGTSVNGIVAATAAKLSNPQGIAFDRAGNLYIADSGNQSVRKVSVATGKISTLAGTGEIGFSASPVAATSATFHGPAGIAVDTVGNVYVVDSGNHVVRELLTEAGNVIVVAGTGQAGNSGDGGAATAAKLNQPTGLVLDAAGDLFVSDTGNSKVRKIEANGGEIDTVAGATKTGYTAGIASSTQTQMAGPVGLALDGAQTLYVADTGNNVVRRVGSAPGEVQLPLVAVGTTSSAQTVRVANTGNAPLTVSSVAKADATTSNNFVLSNTGGGTCSGAVAAGTHCAFTVAAAPTVGGFVGGKIDVVDDAPGTAAKQTVYLLGGAVPTIAFTPTTLAGATLGTAYSATITASGGFGTLALQTTRTLPAGLTASVSGTTVTLTGTPAASGTFALNVFATDTLGTTASLAYPVVVQGLPTLSLPVTESITVSDAAKLLPTVSLPVVETITVSDVSTSLPTLLLPVNEAIAISDTAKLLSSLLLPVTESITVSDGAKLLPSLLLPVNEAISVSDLPNLLPTLKLPVIEGIQVSDRQKMLPTVMIPVIETVSVSDGPKFLPTLLLPVAEGITVSDGVGTPKLATVLGLTPAAGVLPATVGAALTPVAFVATGGAPTVVITASGVVPGLAYATNGTTVTLSGTPTTAGSYPLSVSVVDGNGVNLAQSYTLTVAKAATSTVLTSSTANANLGAQIVLTAKVTPATSGTATGTVTFYDGTTAIGSGKVAATTVTLTTSSLAAGTHILSAQYTGDANYIASSSGALTQIVTSPDYSIAAAPASLTLNRGQTGQVVLTLTSVGGYAGTVSLSCGTLPTYVSCGFVPKTITFTGTNTSQTSTLSVATTKGAVLAGLTPPNGLGGRISAGLGLWLPDGVMCGLLMLFRVRRSTRLMRLALLSVLALAGMQALTGCGNAPETTPAGSYTVPIQLTDGTGSGATSHSLNLNIVINP